MGPRKASWTSPRSWRPILADPAQALLLVEGLVGGYGKKRVLNEVSLEVPRGEIVALIGHNGAGKSTLLKCIYGLLPIREGKVVFDGELLLGASPREALRRGMGYAPQGNRVFGDMTVLENLKIGSVTFDKKQGRRDGIERVLGMFPVLRERLGQRAGTLSGGEKQMLALANASVMSPRCLLLDEPSLGLAPKSIGEVLGRVVQLNRDEGVTVLIVEQKVREVLAICHRVYCLALGRVTYSGLPDDLRNDNMKLRRLFL